MFETECLKPTNVEELYSLSGIAPSSIRGDVCAIVAKAKQETNEAYSLYRKIPAERRLKYINYLTFQSFTTQQSLAWKDGRPRFDETMMIQRIALSFNKCWTKESFESTAVCCYHRCCEVRSEWSVFRVAVC